MSDPLFELGDIVITENAYRRLSRYHTNPIDLLNRHVVGDSDGADPNVVERTKNGQSILSTHKLQEGIYIWISTNGERTQTRISLP